ncbi:hypothetical protein [Streptomyces shenzhenensis]|uniref:hypothetical protein n=1 Tax=Streptomyces shenzhenensis TaxID=943815 RepID=UPI001F31A306|nr:hypothetical protein [Streptomyces shenzhenensis]
MFNINLGTVDAQIGGTVALSIFNDPSFGNRAVMTAHYEDEDAFEDSTVILMLDTAQLDVLAKAIERAREALAAAEQGGMVGLATWAEKNAG